MQLQAKAALQIAMALAVSKSSYFVHCCCADSYESILHRTNIRQFALNLRKGNEQLRQALKGPKIERFIGVIYLPKTERYRSASFPEAADKSMCCVSFDTDALNHFTSACKAAGPFLVPSKLYGEFRGQQQDTLGGTLGCLLSLGFKSCCC